MSLDAIRAHCKALRLPTVAQVVEEALVTSQREEWPLETFLQHLLEQEMAGRRQRRITRLTKAAHLPPGKTLQVFDQQRLALRIRRQLPRLSEGEFIDRGDNIDDAVIAMAKANPSTGFVLIPDALSDLVAGDQAGVDKFCGPSDNLAVAIGSEFGDPDVKLVCFGPVVTADEIREHVEPALFGVG